MTGCPCWTNTTARSRRSNASQTRTSSHWLVITKQPARGGFRGGGRTPPPQGFEPCRAKEVPLWYFLRNPFLVTDPKVFLKATSAPIYTFFEGERAPKKRDFFVSIFQKVPKNGFFDLFFKNFPKSASFYCSGELRKSIRSTWKKNDCRNFRKFFENPPHPPPPRENPRFAPANSIYFTTQIIRRSSG